MIGLVLDASVAVKWYIPEDRSASAVQVLEAAQRGDASLHVPDLFYAEFGNVLWKKVRRGEINQREAGRIVRALLDAPLEVHAAKEFLNVAVALAFKSGRTVYDCIYLALALLLRCELITGDEKLANAVAGTPWGKVVRGLSEGNSL